MKKMPKGRNYNILNNMPVFLPFSNLGKHISKCALDQPSQCMVPSHQLPQGQATTMQSLVDLLEVQADIFQAEPVGDTTTQIVEVKEQVEDIALEHMPHKEEVRHMVQVACLVLDHGVQGVAVMELVLQIILEAVHMLVLALVVAQT